LFNGPQQGELENGGGAGGDGDAGGQGPPPPPTIAVSPQPSPVGGNPPGVCPPKNPHCGGG
jgi:hypothetical protein